MAALGGQLGRHHSRRHRAQSAHGLGGGWFRREGPAVRHRRVAAGAAGARGLERRPDGHLAPGNRDLPASRRRAGSPRARGPRHWQQRLHDHAVPTWAGAGAALPRCARIRHVERGMEQLGRPRSEDRPAGRRSRCWTTALPKQRAIAVAPSNFCHQCRTPGHEGCATDRRSVVAHQVHSQAASAAMRSFQ